MLAALTPWDLAGLAILVVGLAIVLRRDVPKAYGLGFLMFVLFALDQAAQFWGGTSVSADLAYQASSAGSRPWTVVSSIFVHAGLTHIVGNLFILLTAGPALEDRVGDRKFLVIFFTAGLAAVAAHTLLTFVIPRVVPPESLALGASGAIFGVLTAFAVRYPRERLPLILFFVVWLPSFAVLLVYLGMNLVYMFTQTSIAWWGHFAGFLVGLPFAYTLPKHASPVPPSGGRGLPDPEKLAPYALTPETRRILDNIRQFSPDARTRDDTSYASAWVDKFFAKATCPQGHAFHRSGFRATCAGGETVVDFQRAT